MAMPLGAAIEPVRSWHLRLEMQVGRDANTMQALPSLPFRYTAAFL